MNRLLIAFVFAVSIACMPAMADVLDLTTAGAIDSATAAAGGLFYVQQVPDQSTGTGVIDSFLRVQPNGQQAWEQGFNTSISTPLDDKGGVFTRALTLGEVPSLDPADIPGTTTYRQFLLDINQTGCPPHKTCDDPLLSLSQIQIFTRSGDTDQFLSIQSASGTAVPSVIAITGGNLVFQMSATGTFNDIWLNYALNSGSGSGDMFLYVPASDFAGLPDSTNIILYSYFGIPPGPYGTNDGFEEWSVIKGPGQPCIGCEVPEPGSLILLGTGLLSLGIWARRRRS